MSLFVEDSWETNFPRTGHAMVYGAQLQSLLAFGGLASNGITSDAVVEANSTPLHMLPLDKLSASAKRSLEEATELPEKGNKKADCMTWEELEPSHGAQPRSRHGHFLHCYKGDVYLIGGNHWSLHDEFPFADMAFNIETKVWRKVGSVPMIPARFAAAVAPLTTARYRRFLEEQSKKIKKDVDDNRDTSLYSPLTPEEVVDITSVVVIGGMSDQFALTNTVSKFDFNTMTNTKLECVGDLPPKQFKGSAVYEECSDSVYLIDGYFDEAAEIAQAPQTTGKFKKVRVLNLKTGVWRTLCSATPYVRSQIVPRYAFATFDGKELLRLLSFHVLGGMRMHGQQNRVDLSHKFNVLLQMWEGDEGRGREVAGFRGATAHTVVEIPTLFVTEPKQDASAHTVAETLSHSRRPRRRLVSFACYGGNVDKNKGDQNSYGLPTRHLSTLAVEELNLVDMLGVHVHRLRIPYAVNCKPKEEQDALLDELF